MLKNYLLVAWRNIARYKVYSIINVFGLALGICACLVIFLIGRYDFSFDDFHPGQERIYRIREEKLQNDGMKDFRVAWMSDLAVFERSIAGFEVTMGFHPYAAHIDIPASGKRPAEKFEGEIPHGREASVITSPAYFDIFKYRWLAGNSETALADPYEVVLTKHAARKYFGNGSLDKMIGKTVIFDDSLNVTVTGIVEDWTGHTNFGFENFISISTATNSCLKKDLPTTDWNGKGEQAFIRLAKGTSPASIDSLLTRFIRKNEKTSSGEARLTVGLEPLNSIHFTHDYHRKDDGDPFYKPYLPTLYALMALALFILVIAAANFINLSTAQSFRRSKEVGIRKVMGGKKTDLTMQFLIETGILVLLAVFIAILMTRPVLTIFSAFLPDEFEYQLFSLSTVGFLLFVILVTTLLAGFYPARVLSAYLPAWGLKGSVLQQRDGGWNLRRGLIVFQFTISLAFISGAFVIGSQLRFMRDTDKGFASDAILTIHHWGKGADKLQVLADRIKSISGVTQVIFEGNSPMGRGHGDEELIYKGKRVVHLSAFAEMGDEGYIPFYQMKLIAGRNMAHSDTLRELVINETCARAMGFTNPAGAVGQFLYRDTTSYPVVGVVADFYEISFHNAIRPDVIEHNPQQETALAVKLLPKGGTEAAQTIVAQIGEYWKQIYPGEEFNHQFVDEDISRLFKDDETTARLVNAGMIITIFISCIGLFGMSLFSAERRGKEIGIRRVLGARVTHIISLLSKDITLLIMLATLIATPIAWYFMEQWLKDFVYRISINWWIFGLSGLTALLIALLTISAQSIKAAIAKPVEYLRREQ